MKFAHRCVGALLALVLTAFLASAVIGAVQGDTVTPVMLWLAAAALLVGVVFAMVRSVRLAATPDVNARGPLPVFLFVLFAGFIGGIGLEHTILASRPTIAVTASVSSCGVHNRSVKCNGTYTVDGEEHREYMPVRSVPRGGVLDIEVLRSDPSVVVTKSWQDFAFFRLGGIVLIGLAAGFGVRWWRNVHSIGSNPSVR